jgi:hypothetical protein
MNIPDFDRWINVNEKKSKFDATIKINSDANKDGKDEIKLEVPNGEEIISYTIDDDKNVKSTHNDDPHTNVDDISIKKYVIKTAHNIDKLQDITQSKELDRLTGGDEDTDIYNEIKGIIDDKNNLTGKSNSLFKILFKNNNTEIFNGGEKNGKIKYVPLDSNIIKNRKYKFDIPYFYGKSDINRIGRGEYLLPLLFDDVYKEPVFTKGAKGDNYILDSKNNKYHLELKGPGAAAPYDFTKKMKLNLNNLDKVKNAIADVFVRYITNQQKHRDNLYMCIFKENTDSLFKDKTDRYPEGMLFINVTKSDNNEIFDIFKDLIKIDNHSTSRNKDFIFTYDGVNIVCQINNEYFTDDIKNELRKVESIVLSRDNFVNEIYTK